MKNTFVELFKLVEENKDSLGIDSLGLKFKDLSTETITTLLHPLIDFNELDINVLDDVDIEAIKKIDKWYMMSKKKIYARTLIIGNEAERVYEKLLKSDLIYEDELNKTIIRGNEYYITVKRDMRLELRHYYAGKDLLYLSFYNDGFYYYDGNLARLTDSDDKFFTSSPVTKLLGVRGVPARIAMALIHSMGFMFNELRFYHTLRLFPESYKDRVIENANSKFIKSVVEYDNRNIREHSIVDRITSEKIRNLLSVVSFDKLLDLDYMKARELYEERD